MAMGMSYEDYWEGSPYLAVIYRKSYRLKRQIQNEQAWLQGFYFYNALAVGLGNAFRKRGSQPLNYMEKPIDIFPLTKEEKKQREREEYEKMNRQLQMIQQAQKRKKKQGGE